MILEREDWEEPGMLFLDRIRRLMRFIPGKDIIRSWKRSREYDRLIAMDAAKEGGRASGAVSEAV